MKDSVLDYLFRTKVEELDVPAKNFRGEKWITEDVTLRSNIVNMRKHLENNYFLVIVIVGPPGEGKSTFAGQLCNDIDPSFDVNRMCRNSKEFSQQLYTCPEISAINFDEGALGLLSREAMMMSNRVLAKSFMVARAKKLLLVICIPDYFMLDKFIRSNMVNGLFVIPKRGNWNFYNGKQARSIGKAGSFFGFFPRMRGHFGAAMPFKADYLDRKMKGVRGVLKDATNEGMLTPPQAAERCHCSRQTVFNAIKAGILPAEKERLVSGVGCRYLIKPSDLSKFIQSRKVKKN